jgi:hypothetical protein
VLQALANLVQQQEVMLQQLQQLNMAPPTQMQQQTPADAAACPAVEPVQDTVTCNGCSGSGNAQMSGAFKSPFLLRQDQLEQLLNRNGTSGNNNSSSSHPDVAAASALNPSGDDTNRWQSPFDLPSSAAAAAGVGQYQQQQQQQYAEQQQHFAEQPPGYAFQLLQQATAEQWERVASMTAVVSRQLGYCS